ncbi:hypothetical protein KIW84_065137 [Lathyrus oleraceus]|uniref:Uncharacterized protein n=1 Tax=Pisum sativum TaxID=3888 RepID=A0A9D4WDP4_PEA|nr:hypothetical protein KIW84_065137 [Pisum sativum]
MLQDVGKQIARLGCLMFWTEGFKNAKWQGSLFGSQQNEKSMPMYFDGSLLVLQCLNRFLRCTAGMSLESESHHLKIKCCANLRCYTWHIQLRSLQHLQKHLSTTKPVTKTSDESWGIGRAVSRIPRVAGGGTHCVGQASFAIATSAVPSLVLACGHQTESVQEFPLIVGDSAEGVEKTKEAIKLLKHIGAFLDAEKAKNSHGIRPGKGLILMLRLLRGWLCLLKLGGLRLRRITGGRLFLFLLICTDNTLPVIGSSLLMFVFAKLHR